MVNTRFIFNIINIIAFILILIQASVIATSYANNSIADASNVDTSSTNNISNDTLNIDPVINCEAKGLNTLLLRDEKSHSCIDSPLSSYISKITTAGLEAYTGILLRLNMRDSVLFSDNYEYQDGQCSKEGRADPRDPRISFAICSNLLIIKSAAYNSIKSVWATVKSGVQGENVGDAIAKQWKFKPEDIYIIKKNIPIGDTGTYAELGLSIPIHSYVVVRDKDKICVAARGLLHALGISDTVLNVGCKYIKEPCSGSIYSNFLSSDSSNAGNAKCYEIGSGLNSTTESTEHSIEDQKNIVKCANMESCYQNSVANSQTLLPITGPIVSCLQQMIKRIIGDSKLCREENGQVIRSSDSNVLTNFRDHIRQAVVLVLCVYVIFECIKILLSMGNVKGYNVTIGLLKLILVAYFSIGINVGPNKSQVNGIHDLGMGILNGSVINGITNWVLPSSDNKKIDNQSRLCQFNRSEYDPKFQDLALWDAIDCRLSHYLGINAVMDFVREQKLRLSGDTGGDPLGVSIPPYYYLLVPALYSGNITLIMMALSYPMLVIGLVAYMVTSFITCLIGVIILGVLAPIFVPMSLFNYTKNYFDGWAKLIISFVLQPMVIMVFIMMSFHVYDYGFYTKCKYNVKQVVEDDNRARKMFYIDVRSKDLYGTNDDVKNNITRCKRSLGWMLNNPVFAIIDSFEGNTVKVQNLSEYEANAQKKFDSIIDDAKIERDGLVFKTVNLIFQTIRDFIMALLTACIMLYLIQHLCSTISSFIQSLVGGVDTSSMSVQPQQAINLMKAGVNYASGQISQATQDLGKNTDNKTDNTPSGQQNKSDNTTRRGINR